MSKLQIFTMSLILFVGLDFVWLGFVMSDFNMRQLAEIGRIENGKFQMNFYAAAVTYFLMALAVTEYVLPKLKAQDSLKKKFMTGATMGLIIYGVFDMTNLAVLKNYPLEFILPDMAWGSVVFGLVTTFVSKLNK